MKVSVIACIVACATVAAAIPPPGAKFGPGGFGPGAFGPKAFGPGGFGPGAFGPKAFGPGAFGPGSFAGPGAAFMPSADMINAFIPTPEEIAALNALKTTPAPGTPTTTPGAGPTTPPTMPPAVANLVSKYMKAASAFMPPSPPTPII